MHVILTHEQADFDAIGALLGAALLNESATPLLPRRTNRNVHAFLTLYGADLPFIDARDLPVESIEQVTLVDTQGLITLKGITAKTRINVIDHHQARPDLSKEWAITTDQVGACTTLFVESLMEHNGALSVIHATLLLLGIYEDTGSLTYASTTQRDARAVANLLEMGASLRIANEYLNPPLSVEQRQLYDRLLVSAETHVIHGQSIIITRTSAEEISEEISSVAHKLRDLLDPDALFLLANTSEGIRLIARSTSDGINVSEITAHFGGGGHERAAAALIHTANLAHTTKSLPPLEQVYQELLHILPEHVRPSITVGQIMSRRPLLLQPTDTAQKAAQLMQRYGYEGYPVVDNGKVIGLLTRRAVDRAISHKLNLPVTSLMEAGEITIHPEDTLEHLQNMMTSTGWGQIPVVNSADGEIIGIVTRTDLLKTLSTGETLLPGKKNLTDRLEAALPVARLALLKTIAVTAHEQHLAVYIVGGFVRDLIMDRPSLDFDVVVEGDAIALGRRLASLFGGRVVSHGRFGTAKWWIADARSQLAAHFSANQKFDPADLPESLDLIGARTEFYDYPTALPTVERSSIKLDLHRRDFTINTMALRLDGRHYGELYDYWGGMNDLRRGLVRVLHSLSFVDDPTRMLRAVRFEQRFGFQIEARTRQLMDEARPLLRQVTGERLRHELELALSEEHPALLLARFQDLELLAAIHPHLVWETNLAEPLEAALLGRLDPDWQLPEKVGHTPIRRALGLLIWLGSLPLDSTLEIASYLRLAGYLVTPLSSIVPLRQALPTLVNAPPSRVVAVLDEIPLISLYTARLLDLSTEIDWILDQFIREWRNIHPATDGNALLALGVPPGPVYHAILETLRAAWLDGKISSIEAEQVFVKELVVKYCK